MNALTAALRSVVLPEEITPFEHDYVRRINRFGLYFYWAHLPIFVLIALFNRTGPLEAVVLTSVVLAGPTFAFFRIPNQRTVAVIYGITAMLMGGLLVHFGQGPVQIEMHFYFFAQLAMLAVYGNPMVIVAAAVAVALHHALLWAYLPQSVFNYDAPLWVVGVHAAFVVVESVATCSIARSFFDNVIGLEKIVNARTAALDSRNRDMRLVMDHVDQALLTLDRDGKIAPEFSKAVEKWLGKPDDSDTFATLLARTAPEAATAFELSWEQLQDGMLPTEVCLDQLPKEATVAGRFISFHYTPIVDQHTESTGVDRLLVVATDVSAQKERERLENAQSEILRVFQQILRDKNGFLEFFDEAEHIVAALRSGEVQDLKLLKRMIHTLKGNAAIFNIKSLADLCHELETQIDETNEAPNPTQLEPMFECWSSLKTSLESLLGDRDAQRIEIDDREFEGLLTAVLSDENREQIAERIANWRLEPTSVRLQRVARQAQGIAKRLDKTHVDIQIDTGEHMLEPKRWSSFWQAFIHAVRNALDHGIEPPEERERVGKDPKGKVSINTRVDAENFVVEIADDGRGVDWDMVRAKAKEHGFDVDNTEDLKGALFKDGFTTRSVISQFSGRGVGMAALREASEQLGGEVTVESTIGSGTCLRFTFPKTQMAPAPKDIVADVPA